MRSGWLRVLEGLLSVLYPDGCKVCGTLVPELRQASICAGCWAGVRRVAGPVCSICGRPLPAGPGPADGRCGNCLFAAPPFTAARAAAYYEGTLREVIHHFKFGRQANLATPLADLLYQAYQETQPWLRVDVVVAVPLHRRRLRERGFNQSERLAMRLARRIGRPYLKGALTRRRATPPQSGLGRAARAVNVRGAFAVARPGRVRGRCVLLIDDVFTTGATLGECAGALRAAGAREVFVLTVARVKA